MNVRAIAAQVLIAACSTGWIGGCSAPTAPPSHAQTALDAGMTPTDIPSASLQDAGAPTPSPTDDGGPVTPTLDGGITNPPPAGPPTYWHDIAPLVNARCVQCHTAGGLAPFALTSFDAVQMRSAQIAAITAARTMPPWPPASDCAPIQHNRSLTAAQIAVIQAWSDAGAPEGDPGSYAPWPDAPSPLPATPSITVQAPQPYTPQADLLDDYHCFVIDPHLTSVQDVIGVAVHPGNARIVHHVILYEIKAPEVPMVTAQDAATGGHGYTCFGGPGVPINLDSAGHLSVQFVTGWAPGSPPVSFPSGTGIQLSAGSMLVLQVHYNQANGYGMTDQSSLDLYYSPAPVAHQAYLIPVVQQDFTLNPGDPHAEASLTFSLSQYHIPLNVLVYGSFPHMHLLGTSIRADVTHADGSTDCLIDVPQWNFHWQSFYFYNSPVTVRPNDTIHLDCHYDNSQANQPVFGGVQQAPRTVHWGENTTDEMCLNFVYGTLAL